MRIRRLKRKYAEVPEPERDVLYYMDLLNDLKLVITEANRATDPSRCHDLNASFLVARLEKKVGDMAIAKLKGDASGNDTSADMHDPGQ